MTNYSSKEPLKTRGTYFTDEKIANLKENVEKYEWARKAKESAKARADAILEKYTLKELWELVPSQKVFRSYGVNQPKGCLNCGNAIDAFGNYPYTLNHMEEPWKITCPHCKMKFPTNDFGAFYKSGLNEKGEFIPENADRSLLVNTLYPERGEKWGVDDGTSYVHTDGEKYFFVAYYCHFAFWSGGIIPRSLSAFQYAYLYTGEQKYADAGIVILNRIGDLYPSYNITDCPWSAGYRHSGGRRGKIIGSIWETGLIDNFTYAYDAYFRGFPTMGKEALELLHSKDPRINTYKDVMVNIEDGYIKTVYPTVKEGNIYGNNGMHQYSLALAAVVLDDAELSKEWLDYVFRAGGIGEGGNVSATFVNDIDRDGFGHEASPGYNSLWLNCYLAMANLLRGYVIKGTDLSYDLYENVKFKKMFDAGIRILATPKFTPNIGDVSSTGAAGQKPGIGPLVTAFKIYGEPKYAKMIYYLANGNVDNMYLSVFDKNPESFPEKIKAAVREYGKHDLAPEMLTGYGFASCMNINEDDPARDTFHNERTTMTMYFGRNAGHGHRDTLNIELFAFDIDMTPEMGYPEFCDGTPHQVYWVSNTVSHNTVLVNDSRMGRQIVSDPVAYDSSSELASVVSVDAKKVYGIERYKRTSTLVRYDNEYSYVVDFFSVKGGEKHTYSFHPASSDSLVTTGLNFVKQTDENGNFTGTLVSPDGVWGAGNLPSGYQYLDKVQRDNAPAEKISFDWSINEKRYTEAEDIHLKLTMIGKLDNVVLANGTPPRNKAGNPKGLDYVLASTKSENGDLSTLFVSVIEPYIKESFILSADTVPVTFNGDTVTDDSVKAVKVTFKNGRADYIVYSEEESKTYTIDGKFKFKGFFGVCSIRSGGIITYTNDAVIGGEEKITCLHGVVKDFTKELSEENSITVCFDEKVIPDDIVGRFIYIENDGIINAVYKIIGAKKNGEDYILDTGDVTPIRSFKKASEPSEGYIYDIEEGRRFYIRLSETSRYTGSENIFV